MLNTFCSNITRPTKRLKCPFDYIIRKNTKCNPDYVIRTASIYIRKFTSPILQFYSFNFSLSLSPLSQNLNCTNLFLPVLCFVLPFMLITHACILQVWIAEGVIMRLCTLPLEESVGRRRRRRV